MKQKYVFGLCIFILGISIPSLGPVAYTYITDSTEIESANIMVGDLFYEEYLVYSAYIEDRFSYDTIVMINKTFWGVYMVYAMGRTEGPYSLDEDMPTLSEETYEDFVAKNKESYILKDSFDVMAHIVLTSEEELNNLFEDDGWSEFYEIYPSSQGIMNVSRVGFNTEMNQAFFYVGNQNHWLSGSGYYVLLEKKNGVWRIKNEVMIWIS